MIEDSATVRARIQADPQTLPFQEAERRLETVLWNAALAIGVGRIEQVGSLAGLALPIRGLPEDEALLAEGAIDGLMVGAGMPKPALLLNWPRFDAPFGDMLRIACSTAGQPTLAFALERIVARELARASRLSRPAQLGSITVRRLSLRDVIAGVPAAPGGGATLLKLPLLRPRRLFLFEIVGEGLSGTALRQLITDQLITRLSRVLFGRRQVRTSLDATVRVFATARRLIARIRRKLYALPPDLPPALPGAQPADDTPGRGNEADWDAFFGTEDPWSYGNAYEQVKYRRTLDLLQSLGSLHGDARAIELACAEGMFTRMLAPVVGKLLATDISAVAIERAAKRCAGIDNVSFDTLDFFNADIGGPWDVIVCSEVLYYMGGPGELPGFADRVASALAPDGVFVHAHAFEVTDDPGHTGFDWNDPFSAHTISRVFRGTAGLERAAAIETDLYLIEVYRRATSSDQRSDVTPQIQPIGAELEPNLAAWVVWNGAIRVRPVLDETVRSSQVPVLMYHSISDDGPSALAQWRVSPRDFEHQLRFLRRRGFRATYPEEWDYETRRHGALRGRPILITFDDGYANFHETALPILERNGFSAHLFVVTGKVGGCADWDDTHGKPLPLMDWRALADCRARGTSFGSHLCYHRAATHLSDQALLEEATRSRAILADRLGIDATTVAPPYGATDDRVAWLCAKAGYRRLFTVEPGVASAWAQKLRTPRLEVSGDMSIGRFAEMLGVNEAEAPTKDDEPT
jgi:peptidoglycan/xylan/chitin deacetylase (PgdA/CDA1 family)